jgi:hypothetical protein
MLNYKTLLTGWSSRPPLALHAQGVDLSLSLLPIVCSFKAALDRQLWREQFIEFN